MQLVVEYYNYSSSFILFEDQNKDKIKQNTGKKLNAINAKPIQH